MKRIILPIDIFTKLHKRACIKHIRGSGSVWLLLSNSKRSKVITYAHKFKRKPRRGCEECHRITGGVIASALIVLLMKGLHPVAMCVTKSFRHEEHNDAFISNAMRTCREYPKLLFGEITPPMTRFWYNNKNRMKLAKFIVK